MQLAIQYLKEQEHMIQKRLASSKANKEEYERLVGYEAKTIELCEKELEEIKAAIIELEAKSQ